MPDSGIYIITNSANGKVYVGQSRNLKSREYSHFHALEKGTHHNKYLQRAYNTHGPESFSFGILEKCDVSKLDDRERFWIKRMNSMDSKYGYNLEAGGNVGKEVSEKTREAKRGANNPMFGKKISEETKSKMRASSLGQNTNLTEEQVYEIKDLLLNAVSTKVIAERYGITTAAVYKIKTGVNFGYVHSDINNRLQSMEEERKARRDKIIFVMEAQGISRAEISKSVGCTPATVSRVLGSRSNYYRDSEKNQILKSNVVNDFMAGMPKKEIIAKYNISPSKYVEFISEAYNKKCERERKQAIELRNSGMMVKDIAAKLGRSRLTISKWAKETMLIP